MLSIALFSSAWLKISGLTLFVALVPLLLISGSYDSSRRSFWRMFGWTALTFGLWNVATAWWIWYAAPIGTIASTVAQILLFGTVFMLYHYVSKRAKPLIAYIVLIAGWIAAEYLYLTGEISFPWILLGNGFANDTWAVQWYEYTGVFGGSLWVLLTNVLIYNAVISRDARQFIAAGLTFIVPLIVSLIMFWSYKHPEGERATVTIVQPNIDPYNEKFVVVQSVQNERMLRLAAEAPDGVDYIVFPETALDDYIWEEYMMNSRSITQFRAFLTEKQPQAKMVVGAMTQRKYNSEADKSKTARKGGNIWYDTYNSALALDTAEVQVYHKRNLVVGVEKMPYANLMKHIEPLVIDLGGTTGQLGYDDAPTVFTHKLAGGDTVVTAAPICYDSIYGEYCASLTGMGSQLLFVITNDGWWHDTPGHKQHFAYSRLRAIETRRFVARSANTGISGIIDPRGDVVDSLGWDKEGTLTGDVILNDKVTFYAKYGDYIARICNLLFLLSLLYFVAYRYRRRSHLVE